MCCHCAFGVELSPPFVNWSSLTRVGAVHRLRVQNFVFRQDYQYFQCHSYPPVCDTCLPLYLTYNNCTAPTGFSLTIPFVMPKALASVRTCRFRRANAGAGYSCACQ